MFRTGVKVALSVTLTCLSGVGSMIAKAQQIKRPFTTADEIEIAHFGDPYMGQAESVRFSPDGNYFAVDTERERLDLRCVEDSLRFYREQDVENFLMHSDDSQPPSPVWVVTRSNKEGPIIRNWRWLADSSGVAFLERTVGGNQRLILAALRKKMIEHLTSDIESVKAFDVHDRRHYAYIVTDPAGMEKRRAELQGPVTVGTGRSLVELLLPDNPRTSMLAESPSYRTLNLWVVAGGKRFEVKRDGAPLIFLGRDLALSPDGGSLVTTWPVSEVPPSWNKLYPPPFAFSRFHFHTGNNDSQSSGDSVHQYVRITLKTGRVQPLTDAPVSNDAGWWALGSPSWSNDSQLILLPGTFLSSMDQMPSRPCVAVVDLSSNARTCVEMLKGHTEEAVETGYHLVRDVRFIGADGQHLAVIAINHADQSVENTEYRRTAGGSWQVVGESTGDPGTRNNDLEITVKQGLSDPPLLLARNKQVSRVILDPNPQLNNIELGQVIAYTWNDKEGRERRGGLYKPNNYKAGQRYPLVIQTHGFEESEFRPSGAFPTAFAARELAAAGIAVLQVGAVGECGSATSKEGPCNASGYEIVAKQLVSEGLANPNELGIIGFSRTCFHVMEELTTGSLRFKAASITDGVMADYVQYIIFTDQLAPETNSMLGAAPFGDGLQQWLKRSPGFNLDKVTTPLLVVGEGPVSLLSMWEPYAGLRYLHKPVDLIILNTDEHVLTNPDERMASQGGSVDWFRFWLQDYEDPAPAKAEQYKRWRELRKLQEATEGNSATPQSALN
jgi:dipeptidyl aminopeptidase/acylaminoacyl peptidase